MESGEIFSSLAITCILVHMCGGELSVLSLARVGFHLAKASFVLVSSERDFYILLQTRGCSNIKVDMA